MTTLEQNILKDKFVSAAVETYHRGMLDFEAICECIIADDNNLSKETKSAMQDILDKAQAFAEEGFNEK